MSNRFPITTNGFEKLKEELLFLQKTERPIIIKAIAEARAHGDLSENAEYHAAKERQAFLETKIVNLESKLSMAEVIDISKIVSDHVQFGASLEMTDLDTSRKVHYRIVGDYEANIESNDISLFSPIAKALLGKKVGDEVEIIVPNGSKYYKIDKISYIS